MSTASRLTDRYPDQHDPRRTRQILIFGLVAVMIAGLGLAWLGYSKFASKPVSGEAAGYQVISQQTVEVSVRVTRTDPSQPASCIIRARDRDGAEVGRREVYVPPSNQQTVVITSEVSAVGGAAVGDVFGCGIDVPAYLDRS